MSGARLRRWLISSKTVEISWAKFHEIQKTNNAPDDVTMTSNTYRFCWKQVLKSKVWCRLWTYSPQFFLSRWRRTACTEFFSWFQCMQTVFKINTIIYRNQLFTDEFHYLKWIIKCTEIVYIYIMVSYIQLEEWKYWF